MCSVYVYCGNDCVSHCETNSNTLPCGMGNTGHHNPPKYDRYLRHKVSSQKKHKKMFNQETADGCRLEHQTRVLLGVWVCKYFQLCFTHGCRYWLLAQGWNSTVLNCILLRYCNAFNRDVFLCWTTRILKLVCTILFQAFVID